MCGRFTLRTPPAAWLPMFLIDPAEVAADVFGDDHWRPRYNLAPTQNILAVIQDATDQLRRLTQFRWGLLPSWAEDLSMGARMINARSETVAEKPSFRKAFLQRRCLIPADGYLEWKRSGGSKQPYLAHRPGNDVFAFAGLYERNRQATGQWIETCTILTTTPNAVTGTIHDRMPVVLSEEVHARWLDPSFRDTTELTQWLVAPNEAVFRLTAVSQRVNNARHDDPACLAPREAL